MTQTTELAKRDVGGELAQRSDYMPVMGIDQAIERYNAVVQFAQKVLKPGIDYGVIPGTGKKVKEGERPSAEDNTLLKPGAEKLCTLFGLVPDFEDYRVIEDWDKGLFYYAYKCRLTRNGRLVASAIGSANSREKKYRRETRTCPDCGAAAIKRSRYAPKNNPQGEPGWYCESKAGGCGRSFDASDPEIVNQQQQVDPMASADLINTLQKMAQKRALVGATLIATNASEFFTQDVEDMEIVDHRPRPQVRDNEDDAYRVNQNGEPDLSHDATFIAEYDRAITERKAGREKGRAFLDAVCRKHKTTLAKLPAAKRQEILAGIVRGDCDVALGVKAAGKTQEQDEQPAPTLEEATATWDTTLAEAKRLALELHADLTNEQFDQGIESWLEGFAKCKANKTTVIQRAQLLDAIREDLVLFEETAAV